MPRACIHLEAGGTDREYAQFFLGVGLDYALVCPECRKDPEVIGAYLTTVSQERFAGIETDGDWLGEKQGIAGRPEVLVRPTGLGFEHREVALAGDRPAVIAALGPVPSSPHADCLVLAKDGEVLRVEPGAGSVRRLMNALDPERALHVSPCGEMAAVVEARGRYGIVLDLRAGRPTMRLDRGGYRPEHSDFPAAFFEIDGRLLLAHGTDWNRLDVSDPRTGELLTARTPTSYRTGEDRPEHYLDFFRGGLSVSPGGGWIVDNGWVWSPSGVVTAWSLRRWVGDNPWESEDGPSMRALYHRAYFWGGPLCWVDDRSVAVWGYGNDDENLIPAALMFDVESGHRVHWFAGPDGTFSFDRYLFSCSAKAGTSVWDVATGERLLHDASFHPTAYHPGVGAFVTALPGEGFRLTRLVGG